MDTQAGIDRLMTEIGQTVLGDANYVERDWIGIALVFRLFNRTNMSGYVYDRDGEWEAETPSSFDVLRTAQLLREAMAAAGKGEWKTCLVQIKRPGPKLTIDFDYDDVDRWAITPGNLLERVEDLRPG